ncbi:MAG: DNA translocase FtsK [Chloroflexi bacterium]|nr:DNA translocase FtsK [Chloroflexota bacterium]
MTVIPTRDYLNFQADRIEAVLASHRVPVRVHSGMLSPRWMRFFVAAAPGARLSVVRNLSEEIAMALGADNVRIAREGHSVAVEVPRSDPEPVLLLPMLRGLPDLPPHTACLGLADDGRPLLLRLPSPNVTHVLVAGATGSGKTELMRAIAISLALTNRQRHLQFALIDTKSRGFSPLVNLPHLMTPPAFDAHSAAELLEWLNDEMDRRDAQGVALPRIVIMVDEVVDLLMVGGKPVETSLIRLAQRGREAGLHLIVGAQKPSAGVLGAVKANLPVRLVGRVSSADDARVASGVSASGAEKLSGGGDFIAVAGGQVTRFQAAYLAAHDWAQLPRLAREGRKWMAR